MKKLSILILGLSVSSDIYICKGQAVNLEAIAYGGTPSYMYIWDHGASGAQVSVSPYETTSYSVHVVDLNGCISPTKYVTVNVYPDISVKLITLDDKIIPDSKIKFGTAAVCIKYPIDCASPV